jgi:hypothetical protein
VADEIFRATPVAKKKLFDPNPGGFIEHDHNNDGIDRRGFLKCMAWAGTGAHPGIAKDFSTSKSVSK